jgi:hypothetical protein
MLRSGLVLLTGSSLCVGLRSMEVVQFPGHEFKILCSLALLASISCFLATYCMAEFAHSKHHK